MTKCKCLCHKEVPSGTIRAFSHIEDCLHKTKWKEELKQLHREANKPYLFVDDYENAKEQDEASIKIIKDFISNLIEQVIEDASATYAYTSEQELELKQQLRERWLNQASTPPTPEQMDKMFMNTWDGKPLKSDMPEDEFKGYPVSELFWFSPEDLKEHDKEIIEQVIEDIPDEHNGKIYAKPDRLRNWFDLKELKQKLRDKYLN